MSAPLQLFSAALLAAFLGPCLIAQQRPFERLNSAAFGVISPAARVRGTPGQMTVQRTGCPALPAAETRRRIVDLAIQEWAFFGFSIVEPGGEDFEPLDSRYSLLSPEDPARVASSIAGYWAVTPQGFEMVAGQNRVWNGPEGTGARWVTPWSAAFVSWIMCESGLSSSEKFQRAIAHHVYIDQAIRARDEGAPQAAFTAYNPGEAEIEPGDLVCSSRRPAYRNLTERRRHMGVGARTHCDVVIKVDEPEQRIFAIGGNVRRSVVMKPLAAVREAGKHLRPLDQTVRGEMRPVFVHLKLRAKSIEANAIDNSPTIKALVCRKEFPYPAGVLALSPAPAARRYC